jgi:hypothetical protein
LAELIAEAEEPLPTPEYTEPTYEVENRGFMPVFQHFAQLNSFVYAADDVLDAHDYKLSVSVAYQVLTNLVDMMIDEGFHDQPEDWAKVSNAFSERADFWHGKGQEIDMPLITDDNFDWLAYASKLYRRMRVLDKQYRKNYIRLDGKQYTVSEKVKLVIQFVLFFRDYFMIQKDWTWYKDLLADLDKLYYDLGGDGDLNTSGGSGGYSSPWG